MSVPVTNENTEPGLAKFASRTSGADLSSDGKYRYSLWRKWDSSQPPLGFVMLNPSTADALTDDPTIRRCMSFAKANGFGGIHVFNLYAFRATQPADMFRAIDPVGPDNDDYLSSIPEGSSVVVAWGVKAGPDRVRRVMRILESRTIVCLGTTKDGHPKHPLYVPGYQALVRFGGAA